MLKTIRVSNSGITSANRPAFILLLLALTLLTIFPVSALAQTCSYTVTPEARYTLDSVATDSSGNAHNPSNTPGLTYNTGDKIEGSASAQFNTAGIELTDGTAGSFLTTAFTTKSLSMYIKPSVLNSGQVLFEEGGTTGSGVVGVSLVIESDGDLNLRFADNGNIKGATHPFPTDGEWHQVGFVYNGDNFWLYLDGYPVAGNTGHTTIPAHASSGGLFNYFGSMVGSIAPYSNYSGLMDEVVIFNSALTTKQMLAIANSCAENNLISHLATMTCAPDAYLVQGATESNWSTIILHSGSNTSDTDDSGIGLNGIGYNRIDNHIWGSDKEDIDGRLSISALQSAGTWATVMVGPPDGLAIGPNYNVGDVDENGHLHLIRSDGNGVTPRDAYVIDADPDSNDYLTVIDTYTVLWPSGQNSDWAFHISDGKSYAINGTTGNLLQITPATGGAAATITDLGPSGAHTSNYGGIFGDVNGYLYAIANDDGRIYRLDLRSDPGADYDEANTTLIATGPSSADSDGARCVEAGLYMDMGDIDSVNIETSLSSNGPRHAVIGLVGTTSNLMIGTSIDVELSVSPNTTATSDDTTGSDDEDGVTFSAAGGDLITADAEVTNTTGSDATLCGWMDADADGTFETSERQCTTSADPDSQFSWTLTGGTSVYFSRFRLCSIAAECQAHTGNANLGEVEDYVLSYDATAATVESVKLTSMPVEQLLASLNTGVMSEADLIALLNSWHGHSENDNLDLSREAALEALHAFLDPDADGRVAVLRWLTAAENGTVGFFAERRGSQQDEWQRINRQLLPGLIDAPSGGEYMLLDPETTAGSTYIYQLIEKEAWGSSKIHGPYILEMPSIE